MNFRGRYCHDIFQQYYHIWKFNSFLYFAQELFKILILEVLVCLFDIVLSLLIKLSSFLEYQSRFSFARCFAPRPVFCAAQHRLDESGQVHSDQPRSFAERLRCEVSAFQSYSDQIRSFAERLHCEASTYFAGIPDSYITCCLEDLTSDV